MQQQDQNHTHQCLTECKLILVVRLLQVLHHHDVENPHLHNLIPIPHATCNLSPLLH